MPITKIGKTKSKIDGGHKRLQRLQLKQQQQQQFQTQPLEQPQSPPQSQQQPQQQILPEVEFSEIFNYASFLWDDSSPTLSSEWPTGPSPSLTSGAIVSHDQLQLPFSITSHETSSKRTTVHEQFFDPMELGGTPGDHMYKSAYFTTFNNESQLADFFAQSNAPPILAPVETSSRWSRMRKMLIYMCGNSTMVKNAVMAFAAFQTHSPSDQKPTIYSKYYDSSREKLIEVLTEIRKDQRVLEAELKHILAVVFLLTYIDLLADDVFKAHANLREAYDTLQLVKSETLGITGLFLYPTFSALKFLMFI